MNTIETRTRTTSTHPAVDATFAAAARLAREATSRRTTPQACRTIVDALSTPALGFAGIALLLDRTGSKPLYQIVAGRWPPDAGLEPSLLFTAPLLLDDSRIGELTVYKHEGAFEEAEAALITSAAAHAALSVARARLLEEIASLRRASATNATRRKPSPRRKTTTKAKTAKKKSR
jgi:hypothetical protein